MYKSILLNIISIFLISFSLSSCEGETKSEIYIQNKTIGKIQINGEFSNDYVYYDKDEPNETFSTELDVNEKFLLYQTIGRGGGSYRMNPGVSFNAINITDAKGNSRNISYKNELDWKYEFEEKSKIPSTFFQKYVLVVKEPTSK